MLRVSTRNRFALPLNIYQFYFRSRRFNLDDLQWNTNKNFIKSRTSPRPLMVKLGDILWPPASWRPSGLLGPTRSSSRGRSGRCRRSIYTLMMRNNRHLLKKVLMIQIKLRVYLTNQRRRQRYWHSQRESKLLGKAERRQWTRLRMTGRGSQ